MRNPGIGLRFLALAICVSTTAVPAADMSSAEKIKVIDTDGDGILTAAEHAAGSKAMFARMDTNKDGYLSRWEWTAGHAALMKKPAK